MSCPSDGYIDGSGMWKSSFLYSWHTSFLTTPLPCRTTASFSCAGSLGPLRVGRGYICLLSKFYCGSFAFWIVGHVPVRYFTHLVYVSGHHFVYSHVAVSGSCRLLEFYTNRGWLASSTLKGCSFLPCAFTVQKKYWFLNKYLFCPCLSLFRRIMWLLQSRMHLADTHLQFQKNITKYYIYVTHSDVIN